MNLQKLLGELEDLSLLKNNWYLVAVTFEKYKKSCAAHADTPQRIQEGCSAGGYRLNTLNRMIAVRKFLDSVKSQVKNLDGVDLGTLSFPSLEVVMRLHRVNPKEGISMLSEVAIEKITYRDLRVRYNKAISADTSKASVQQISKREGIEFEDVALEAIRSSSNELFGDKSNLHFDKARFLKLPFSIDAIAQDLDADNEDFPFGFELFHFRPHENLKRRFELFLERLLFNACFFKATWVVFPSTLGEDRIKDFSEILDLLDRRSIGVAILSWGKDSDGSLKILRRPTGVPSPDWRDMLARFQELHHRLVQPI